MAVELGDAESMLEVWVVLAEPDLDPEDHDQLTRRLRAELDDLDVQSVSLATDSLPPPGAKGDPVTIGALIVALSASGGLLPSLIATVRDWLDRQAGRHRVSVTVNGDTIELDRATVDEQRDLVDAFLRRHAK